MLTDTQEKNIQHLSNALLNWIIHCLTLSGRTLESGGNSQFTQTKNKNVRILTDKLESNLNVRFHQMNPFYVQYSFSLLLKQLSSCRSFNEVLESRHSMSDIDVIHKIIDKLALRYTSEIRSFKNHSASYNQPLHQRLLIKQNQQNACERIAVQATHLKDSVKNKVKSHFFKCFESSDDFKPNLPPLFPELDGLQPTVSFF